MATTEMPKEHISREAAAQHHFHIGDYVVFAMTILVSIAIGVFYAIKGRRRSSTSEYLVGGRAMGFLPTTISLMVSFESSIMMLGLPAESYVYGLQWIWWAVGLFISQMLSVMVIVPLLHPLRVTSAYEYLELRYQSRAVRLMGTVLGLLTYTWYMGVVLYGPAVALEAVTGFPLWNSVFVICMVSVLYTSIGGMKAVIWTDVFQALVMMMGIFSILIKGTVDAGGPKRVWEIASEGGRMNFFNFDPDPRVRHTFWNLCVGSIIRGFGLGFNQSTIQRISSTKSVADAKRMLLLVAPCFLLTLSMASYEGIVTYAYYQTRQCDPLASKQITNPNQLVPFVVMDIFEKLPGMPGLFLASLFSASLSTLSSGLSSLAALTWADILKPLIGDMKEVKATILIKFTVVIFGGLACAVAYCVAQVGGTLTQIAGSLISAFAGPLTGIFFLACFFPRSNAKGCLLGGVTSTIVCIWLSMGMNFSPSIKKTPWLPAASTARCYPENTNGSFFEDEYNYTTTGLLADTTTHMYQSTVADDASGGPEPSGIEIIYTLSYQWLAVVGIFGTIIIGMIGSFLTGVNKPGDVDPRYLISMSDTLLIFLPGPIKRWISSLGPQFIDDKYKAKFVDPSKRQNIMDMETEINVITEKSSHQSLNVNQDETMPPATLELDKLPTSNGDNTKIEQ